MVGKLPQTHQLDFFQTPLVNFIDMDHELVQLAHSINWESVEQDFAGYFSENGRPGVPVRKMVGLLLLKSLYNLSDERVVNRNKKCSDFGKKNYSGNGNSLCSNFGNNSAVTVVLN